jgi:DNA repair protein RecN (Recombination protein N)
VLTGETGAGKSILDRRAAAGAGQPRRCHAGARRRGARRGQRRVRHPPSLRPWLDEAGFAAEDSLLLRRSVDAQGKSRAWINGSPATVAQLREAADHLVDIHGQHAWQGLTRPAAVRACSTRRPARRHGAAGRLGRLAQAQARAGRRARAA